MRWFVFISLLVVVSGLFGVDSSQSAEAGKPDIQYKEGYNLNIGSFGGHAALTTDKTTVKLGETFTVDIRFFSESPGDYYNTYFNGLIPVPAKLAIFDSDKKYLGDLIEFIGGSRRRASSHDWTYIPSQCYVGTFLHPFIAGYIPSQSRYKLPDGDYYLQMIYNKTFILPRPADTDHVAVWSDKRLDRELFRSNVVKVRFVK